MEIQKADSFLVFGWPLALRNVEGRLQKAPRRKMQPTA